MKNLIKKFKFPWYNTKFDSYINYYIENPFKTWWQGRKYFKFPKLKVHFGWQKHLYDCPFASFSRVGKILDIYISDVQWKDKWNSSRHERNPLIWICLFRHIVFAITFHIYYYNEFGEQEDGDLYYWEYLLDWLYYKNKKTLRCYSAWTRDSELYRTLVKYGNEEDGSKDEWEFFKNIIPCVSLSLTKKGISELKKELNDKN